MTSYFVRSLVVVLALSWVGCGSNSTRSEDSTASNTAGSKDSAANNDNGASASESTPKAINLPTPDSGPSEKSDSSAAQTRGGVAPTAALQSAVKSQDEEAIYKAATESLARAAGDFNAMNALGVYHLHKGRPLAAQFFFQKGISKGGDNSVLHNNLGLAFLAQKKDKEALREFKKATELNPRDPQACGNLGAYYLHKRDGKRAFVYLDMGFRYSPKNLAWLLNYGLAATWKGDYELAEKLYKQALEVSPGNADVNYNMAALKIGYLHQSKEGLEIIDRMKVMGVPDSLRSGLIQLENEARAGVK
jgi:tetratricopeptide (TPR) repeat protein